jgi:hypothetical protein
MDTGLTIDEARARAEKARAAFIAVGGTLPDRPARDGDYPRGIERLATDIHPECAGHYATAAACLWSAAEALVDGNDTLSEVYGVLFEIFSEAGEVCEAEILGKG